MLELASSVHLFNVQLSSESNISKDTYTFGLNTVYFDMSEILFSKEESLETGIISTLQVYSDQIYISIEYNNIW